MCMYVQYVCNRLTSAIGTYVRCSLAMHTSSTMTASHKVCVPRWAPTMGPCGLHHAYREAHWPRQAWRHGKPITSTCNHSSVEVIVCGQLVGLTSSWNVWHVSMPWTPYTCSLVVLVWLLSVILCIYVNRRFPSPFGTLCSWRTFSYENLFSVKVRASLLFPFLLPLPAPSFAVPVKPVYWNVQVPSVNVSLYNCSPTQRCPCITTSG